MTAGVKDAKHGWVPVMGFVVYGDGMQEQTGVCACDKTVVLSRRDYEKHLAHVAAQEPIAPRNEFSHDSDCPCFGCFGDTVEHGKDCKNCECQHAAEPIAPEPPKRDEGLAAFIYKMIVERLRKTAHLSSPVEGRIATLMADFITERDTEMKRELNRLAALAPEPPSLLSDQVSILNSTCDAHCSTIEALESELSQLRAKLETVVPFLKDTAARKRNSAQMQRIGSDAEEILAALGGGKSE